MNDTQKAIVVEQREVGFYGDQVVAVRVENDDVYVPIKPICDILGLNWAGQQQRITRDEVLSAVRRICVIHTGSRGMQETLCLPLKYLNGWLFGISTARVRDEVRERLIQYKHECYDVLYEAFQQGNVTARPDPLIDELMKGESPEAQAYQMAMAVANMARQQLMFKARMESAEDHLLDHENRLQIIEADRGNDNRYIINSQALQIAQAVKQIAFELGKRSKRNEFGGVYGELHRQFEIPSYKQLPSIRFNEAMNFLRQWWETITDSSGAPF